LSRRLSADTRLGGVLDHPAVADRLERLAPDQRAAATAPPGPVLCVAPAGSGKTTTLVARVVWLVARGVDPAGIAAITFNRRAAEELEARLADALGPLGLSAGAVRVRTFHALGREILLDAGVAVEPLVDRLTLLRAVRPGADPAELRHLDTAMSRLKLDLGVDPAAVARDPAAGPIARTFVAYEEALAATGGLDFDDLVARALRVLDERPALRDRWRCRCAHLLVDEVQDVDRSQLRLALLLAAPTNHIFLVGDDDQTIYGWRLADVRRVLGLAGDLPGLARVDLVTNYRCPGPVVDRAVRLIERNRERYAKRIQAGPVATGRLLLAPDGSDDATRWIRVLASWPQAGATMAILTRTNRELLPAVVAALDAGRPFRAPRLALPLESPALDPLLDAAAATDPTLPLLVRLAAAGRRFTAPEPSTGIASVPTAGMEGDPRSTALDTLDRGDETTPTDVAAALLAWAPPYRDLTGLTAAVRQARDRLRELRCDDAAMTLATAHATKGLEFDHVAVLMDAGRFPSGRSLADASEPARALEEERRLAYVAWTRARRSLTLVYDPGAPSSFLLEAFEPAELGLPGAV
jgi:superfamily I DNA/RNA helicase